MLYLVCPNCKVGLRISPGEEGELESLFEIDPRGLGLKAYTCFRCELEMASLSLEHPNGVELFDVNPKEAFAAINGLGLPHEQECTSAAVTKLCNGAEVSYVKARQLRNSHRCIVEFIEFESGTRVYLGASAEGAVVYRVAKRHSYAKEVECD